MFGLCAMRRSSIELEQDLDDFIVVFWVIRATNNKWGRLLKSMFEEVLHYQTIVLPRIVQLHKCKRSEWRSVVDLYNMINTCFMSKNITQVETRWDKYIVFDPDWLKVRNSKESFHDSSNVLLAFGAWFSLRAIYVGIFFSPTF